MCEKARSKVTGVPLTIIDGKWCVQGGQSSEVFIQVRNTISVSSVTHPSPTDLQETGLCRSSCRTLSVRCSRRGNRYSCRLISAFLISSFLSSTGFPPSFIDLVTLSSAVVCCIVFLAFLFFFLMNYDTDYYFHGEALYIGVYVCVYYVGPINRSYLQIST